jgi:hypothetical protein
MFPYCYQPKKSEKEKIKYKENTLAYPIFLDKDIWLVKKKRRKKISSTFIILILSMVVHILLL